MIARFQALGAALIAALVTVVAAFGWGRWRGARAVRKEIGEHIASSEHRAAVAEHVTANTQVRTEVETDVLHLPSGEAELVVGAVPDTAVDRLHDSWSRD